MDHIILEIGDFICNGSTTVTSKKVKNDIALSAFFFQRVVKVIKGYKVK